jgi:hypothetical protein
MRRRFLILFAIASSLHWVLQIAVMALRIPIVRPDRMGAGVSQLGQSLGPLDALQWPLVWAFNGHLFDASPLGILTANSVLWGSGIAEFASSARLLRRRIART